MSDRPPKTELGRWPQSQEPRESSRRFFLWFWALLTVCGTAGALVLQLAGPPAESRKTAEAQAPKPAEVQSPAPAMPAPVMATASSSPQDTAPKPPDPPAEAAPSPPSAGSAAVSRPNPTPREAATHRRQRPPADPLQVAVSKLKRQQRSTGEHAYPAAPYGASPQPPAAGQDSWESDIDAQNLSPFPSPWMSEPGRYPYYASEREAPYVPEQQPGVDWTPPPPPYTWYPPAENHSLR